MQWQSSISKWVCLATAIMVFGVSSNKAQTASILKAKGNIAIINAGGNADIQIGDEFRIFRSFGGQQIEIARARATHVTRNLTRIKLLNFNANQTLQSNDDAVLIQSGPEARHRGFSVYLGPLTGVFIPMQGMENHFNTGIGYGGSVGVHFRPQMDLNLRFFFAAEQNAWSFWNLQMLGRRHFKESLLLDFGYGIAYPKMGASLGSGEIRLGFIAGLGIGMPVNHTTVFELGVLYHYYPYFGGQSGQFVTVEARLLL